MSRSIGKVFDRGTNGTFWSAGSVSSTNARLLNYDGNSTNPDNSGSKTSGYSVRCDQGSTRVNDILHKFPFSLPYSGFVGRTDGKVDAQGTDGHFWSAGSDSTTSARYLTITSNYTYPELSGYKTYGLSVRCVVVKFTTAFPVNTY